MKIRPSRRPAEPSCLRLSGTTGSEFVPALFAVLTLALAGAACSGGEGGGDWAGTELDSAGIHLVHNPEEGLWGEGKAWTFEEALRLGALEGPPELQFGQITAMDVDARGKIYVADSQAQEIRVFGPDGTHLRTLGAPGSGPGELGRSLTALFAGDDGSVRVVDMMNQRVTMYAPDGSPDGSFPLDLRGGIPFRWEKLPSGELLAQLRGMGMPGMDAHDGGDPLVVFSIEGEAVDTVHHLPRGRSFEFSGGGMPRITLFEPEPLWDAGPEGTLLTAMNSDYRIEVRNAEAQIRHVLTKPFESRPVEDADKRAFERLIRESMEGQGTPPQAVEMMMRNLSFAESYPAFGSILAGPGGSVWVQHIMTAADIGGGEDVEIDIQDLGSGDWDIFDPRGRFLGVVTLPQRFTPMVVKDENLYGVWADDLDVQHLLRLRIERDASPTT